MAKVSVIIPGRREEYFQRTVDSVLEMATGDIEVIAVVDGDDVTPPLKAIDSRVKVVRLKTAIGQRAAYNLGVLTSTGDYVMKVDAHALLSRGFDEVLQSHCPDDAIVLPEMRRLDVRKWESKRTGKTHFMYPGLDLYCHYWKDYRKRPEAKAEYPEVMTGQGSCWFTSREWNDYIGLLDEGVGSWGNVGIEVSLRTWLCGGSQILNRNAWQAHWFRVHEGRFPYPLSGRDVAKAHRYTWNNYYFKESGAFENQVKPFSWYIRKFAPVPGWEAYLADEYKSPRVALYYTDSRLHESLATAVRKNLASVVGLIPIVSVSQKPLDFGRNICVGELPRSAQSMYRQILTGAKATEPGSIIYLCEHDVFYHPAHFAKLPKDDRAFYFNQARYHWHVEQDTFLPDGPSSKAFSQAVVKREYLIEHCEKRLAEWTDRLKLRRYDWEAERPNVDVRHGQNLGKNGRGKRGYATGRVKGVNRIGGWGGVRHFQGRVGYKGVLRHDIISYLIEQHGYKSYLEIGVDRGDTWKHIKCEVKHGVDPAVKCTFRMTSNEFFDNYWAGVYDLIFVDGLHEWRQVYRDVENALAHLNKGGTIVMHDCSPRNRAEQTVPRLERQRVWTGDVWRAYVARRKFCNLSMYCVNTNNGIGIVRRGSQIPLPLDIDPATVDYAEFERNREEWLNLKSVAWFWANERKRCDEQTSLATK